VSNEARVHRGDRRRQWQAWRSTAVTAIVLAIVVYSAFQTRQEPNNGPAASESQPTPSISTERQPQAVVPKQSIRDLEGRLAFRGDVDVGPTLQRIKERRLLDFPNDGSTFQNRERRLPRRAAGYYKEYVHPTPGLGGPGPQRIVVGEGGEIYYTPDHYRTFQRLDE
jgi:guanyl-specific ribonuclease Sa